LSAAARRDNEPRLDRAGHRVADVRPELRHLDDPRGGHRPVPAEGRPAARQSVEHPGSLQPGQRSVFQFFYLERNAHERDPEERREGTRRAPANFTALRPANESQQRHVGAPAGGRTSRSEVIV